MMKTIVTIAKYIMAHRKTLSKVVLSLCIAFLSIFVLTIYNKNKKLTESLETALNNVEAYLELLSDSLLASTVLKLTVDLLQQSKDSVILELNKVSKLLKIKPKQIKTTATQTLVIDVIASKGVGGDIIVKDTIYNDSIQYNPLTTVYYTISKDTVSIGLNIKNTQYLYIYSKKEYKNKKNFFKRLFTFDFKKITKYKYEIYNTNDLIKSKDVRVIEINNK